MVGAMNLPFTEAIFWQSFSLISDFYNLSSNYLKTVDELCGDVACYRCLILGWRIHSYSFTHCPSGFLSINCCSFHHRASLIKVDKCTSLCKQRQVLRR